MRKRNFFFVVALALIAVTVLIIIFQWQRHVETPTISLPSSETGAPGGSAEGENALLDIDVDSVQAIIASIERPDSYSRKYNVSLFYSTGRSDAEVNLYCKGGQYRIIHSQNNVTKNTLFSDGKVYWWYDDPNQATSADLEGLDADALDLYARLIVYEELLTTPKENIIDASGEIVLGEVCIYVEYRHSERYTYRLYVSVDTGLLVAAEALEDGETIYLMESESAELTVPPDEMFIPPEIE